MNSILNFLKRKNLYSLIDEEDVVSRQQFVIFRIFSWSGILVCIGVFVKMVMTIPNHGFVPYLILGLSGLMLVNFFAVRKVRKLRFAYTIMLITAFLLLHAVAYTCGGVRTGGTLYYGVVVLYSYMLLGKKRGGIFAAVFIAQFIYLYFISSFSDLTSFALFKEDPQLIMQDFMVNGLLSIFMIASLSRYLQSGKNEITQGLEKSKKEVEKSYAELKNKNALLKGYSINLEKSNKELEKFASIASHDLKAPLRAIGGLVGIIEEESRELLNLELRDHFTLIKARVNRMDLLLNALLEYSKADRVKELSTEVNVRMLIFDIIHQLHPGEKVTINVAENLPIIIAERKKMMCIFTHLISNAIRFNDKEDIQISITAQKCETEWHFMVTDNGPGIDKKHHDKIFVIFQTLNCRDDLETMGVGLPIVRKLVEEKGGKIWVNSEKNEGCTFAFSLPLIVFHANLDEHHILKENTFSATIKEQKVNQEMTISG
ncbi:hypothetical protein BH11BAC2_BH11BAC2_01040 [soil metagenome]